MNTPGFPPPTGDRPVGKEKEREMKTWQDILGRVHPEWRNASPRRRRLIRNVAWAHGYNVGPDGIVERKVADR